ncbi:hypothetical protein A3Q56_01738 [Intoshia linei]|uniref:CCHC-type domain-containing protein n=1 Tax=Intoshia linei TaxID=1819745 RepID=A0A177BA05_9BILA|nr:hypothetical protein A3Q56_01738 [Intoshia linei]
MYSKNVKTCFNCDSADHLVRNCKKIRRKNVLKGPYKLKNYVKKNKNQWCRNKYLKSTFMMKLLRLKISEDECLCCGQVGHTRPYCNISELCKRCGDVGHHIGICLYEPGEYIAFDEEQQN